MPKYPSVSVKSEYGVFITIVLDEYFQQECIVDSIIKTENELSTIVNFNENLNNSKLEYIFNELKNKDVFYLNYNGKNIEFSLLKK